MGQKTFLGLKTRDRHGQCLIHREISTENGTGTGSLTGFSKFKSQISNFGPVILIAVFDHFIFQDLNIIFGFWDHHHSINSEFLVLPNNDGKKFLHAQIS